MRQIAEANPRKIKPRLIITGERIQFSDAEVIEVPNYMTADSGALTNAVFERFGVTEPCEGPGVAEQY